MGRLEQLTTENTTVTELVPAINEELESIRREFLLIKRRRTKFKNLVSTVLKDFTIFATETVIPHQLRTRPVEITVCPFASATWFQTRRADDKNIYLRASAEITADIIIKG